VDPIAVRAITAIQNARPYIRDNKEYGAMVRVETKFGEIVSPVADFLGARKMRDTLARIVNARRAGKRVEQKNGVRDGNGTEVRLAPHETPGGLSEAPGVQHNGVNI
jgi:hypothetical protein